MRNIALTLLISLSMSSVAHAQQEFFSDGTRPDHTIWVHIESDPTEAHLFALPVEVQEEPEAAIFDDDNNPAEVQPIESEEPLKIGTTPCVVVVDLSWPKGLVKKKWDDIKIWSSGDSAYAIYYEDDKHYDIFISFRSSKKGYKDKEINVKVAELDSAGAWLSDKDIEGWPTDKKIKVTLEPDPKSIARRSSTTKIPTIYIARRNNGDTSTPMSSLYIKSNVVGADVYVDDELVGQSPINVVMQSGSHEIIVRQDGYQLFERKIELPADARLRLNAKLVE